MYIDEIKELKFYEYFENEIDNRFQEEFQMSGRSFQYYWRCNILHSLLYFWINIWYSFFFVNIFCLFGYFCFLPSK